MPAPPPGQCPGCKIDFQGGKGLSVHLKLTAHPPCRAIFLAAEAGNIPSAPPQPRSTEDQNESFGDLSGHGLPQGHTTFQGDFFGGDYTPEELGYDPDDDAGDPPSSDDEEDNPRVRDHEAASRAGLEDGTSEQAYKSSLDSSADQNPYAPFKSKMDWEVGKWAKLRGSGSTAFMDLLQVEGVREALTLSYNSATKLNKIIDDKLPGRPKFSRSEVVVNGEVFHLYSRDIIECVRALWGDTDFAPYLFGAVEKENPGATIIPIIISSDKTQLTVFGNKTAYPIYMTIRNISKEIRRKPSRRGYILLGYPPTSCMKHVKNKAVRRRILANVFHACMSYMLEPLKSTGITGFPMTSGDGVTRHGHPIYATFVGDYPEQVLVTLVKTGECPMCDVPHDELGMASDYPLRDLEKILEALDTLDSGPTAYTAACEDTGIKPIYHPFWEGLPYTNIFQAISLNVLHQLYQGIVKHLIAWLTKCEGARSNLPHILALVINVQLPDNISTAPLLAAVRGILNFVHLAQYPMHTSETLAHLENALQRFHDNKSIFVALEVRKEFNLPKLHSCRHYVMYIKLFGTTDNYNTEYTEHLHINLAKDAYRSTNFKDEFPQMTLWLERKEKEKVFRHKKYILWHLDGFPAPPTAETLPPGIIYKRWLKMAKNPTLKAVRLTHLVTEYGAKFFHDALARYVVQLNYPTLSRAQVETRSQDLSFSFNSVPVFHRIKFTTEDPYTARGPEDSIVDSIHVQPLKTLKNGELLPARFDTGLINDGTGGMAGIHVIFTLGQHHLRHLFLPGVVPPKHLAYVEWFSPFTTPELDHLMYKINHSLKDGERLVSIVPVGNIRRSVHLLPKFGPVAPAAWKSSTVLDQCKTFFVNSMTDRHIYATIF
ncbi:hypothetical protein DFH08DRAFT_1011044 [Mycena albidolilacea]|uniref:C2H2-type domain-containing protein n=1 Tax=Mycena albidolilacea TaxID=1033008 RepID=A0AAD6ZX20_9AGAR|nr:hypothetical protein DFH08DRAFT_1011044 [Mycena albidolilacea]